MRECQQKQLNYIASYIANYKYTMLFKDETLHLS